MRWKQCLLAYPVNALKKSHTQILTLNLASFPLQQVINPTQQSQVFHKFHIRTSS